MKTKIFVSRLNKEVKLPKVIKKGDWIDLCSSETIKFKAPQSGTLKTRTVDGTEEKYRNVSFDFKLIPLGIAVLATNGLEFHLLSRSSTCKGQGLIQANSMGIIDGGEFGYNGPNDEWKFPALAIRDTTINAGERICQFRVVLSQKATFLQKLRWFLSSGVEIVEVDSLPNKVNRTGFGSTGVN